MENISTFDSTESALKKRPLPSFIKKLWFILNDAASQEHIFWVDNGQVICVPNASNFSKVILPKYFKHSNWQSFVRQLNLYGFRKVYRLNLSYDDTAEKRAVWQFKHDCFRKDNTEKLCEIKRRTAKPNQEQQRDQEADATDQQHKSDYTNNSIAHTLSEFSERLDHVDRKRKELREQTVELSRVQAKQQKVVEVLMDFIMQLLDKYPNSDSDKQRFSKIRQTVMATQPLDYLMNPNQVDMMLTPSLPPPPPPPTPPSPALPTISPPASNISPSLPSISPPLPSISPSALHQHHTTSLPSISSLMADRLEHELPPLQKRRTFK